MEEKLGHSLKRRRIMLHASEKEVAERSGISVSDLVEIESGQVNPSLKTANNICRVLGTDFSRVLYSASGFHGDEWLQRFFKSKVIIDRILKVLIDGE